MAPEQGKRGDLTSGSLLRRKDAIIKWRKNALHGIFSPYSRKILRGQGNKRQQQQQVDGQNNVFLKMET